MQPKALWIYEKQSQFCYTEMQQEILKVNQVAFCGVGSTHVWRGY
jgi:hypothetical protein